MKDIGAIICELNPLHLGHKYLIDFAKKNRVHHLIAIMSGNFVQRGEPAIISKYARTKIALLEGFDLVIELPTTWSVSSAERFALSGVSLIESLGVVDELIFGSECGDLKLIGDISDLLTSDYLIPKMKPILDLGISFAKAREIVVKDILGSIYSDILKSPNNILAVEYLKAIKKLNSNISCFTVKRNTKNQLSENFSSSQIRNLIKYKSNEWPKFITSQSAKIILEEIDNFRAPVFLDNFFLPIIYKLKSMENEDFLSIPDVNEGLENKFLALNIDFSSVEELVNKLSTKRYPKSRIRRIILSSVLDIFSSEQNSCIPYIKVLGSNKNGFEILKKIKNNSKLPIISRFSDQKKLDSFGKYIFKKEVKMDNIYGLMAPKIIPGELFFKQKFISKKDD